MATSDHLLFSRNWFQKTRSSWWIGGCETGQHRRAPKPTTRVVSWLWNFSELVVLVLQLADVFKSNDDFSVLSSSEGKGINMGDIPVLFLYPSSQRHRWRFYKHYIYIPINHLSNFLHHARSLSSCLPWSCCTCLAYRDPPGEYRMLLFIIDNHMSV